MNSTNLEAAHYAVFSSLLALPPRRPSLLALCCYSVLSAIPIHDHLHSFIYKPNPAETEGYKIAFQHWHRWAPDKSMQYITNSAYENILTLTKFLHAFNQTALHQTGTWTSRTVSWQYLSRVRFSGRRPFKAWGRAASIRVFKPSWQLVKSKAAPRRSILLRNISYCTILLTVYGSYWKVVQYIEWIKNGLIFIAQHGTYCIVCGQHCAISFKSLSKGRAVNIFTSE
jgi:hypothetical protein